MARRLSRILIALAILILGVVSQPPRTTLADTGSNWTGNYFNNMTLSGSPVFSRIDPVVVFNWGTLSPGPGIGSTNWSARWTTVQYMNAGTYRFTITADDGVRAYVDGQIILDQWHDQAPTTYTVDVQVVAGNHAIQVDYYQHVGSAMVSVYWNYVLSATSAWTAQYFNNSALAGAPIVTRYETGINYFWGNGSPDPLIPPTNFSARWTGAFAFQAATYRFTLAGDDGVRLFIDDLPVIDQWHVESLTAYSIDVPLSAGIHTLRVEYFQAGGQAAVRLDYSVAVGPPPYPGVQSNAWYGEYFANEGLQGSPSFVRLDGQSGINFNWNVTSPAPGFPRDNFSVRWTRNVYFPGRPYVFYVTVDDGARLWVDSTLLIDAWKVQPATTFSAYATITQGYHIVRLEYFQEHFQSVVSMTWDPPDGQTPPQYINGGPASPTGVTATVTAYALNVRTGPGIGYDILTQVRRGDNLIVLARNADISWVRMQSANAAGWVSSYYVQFNGSNPLTLPVEAPPAPPPTFSTGVSAKLYAALLVRNGPGANYPVIGTLSWGTVVSVIGRDSSSQWYQIVYGSTTGWIYAPYTTIVSGFIGDVPITG
jgi:uncharacterized protein YgiM (DUF1202 family)